MSSVKELIICISSDKNIGIAYFEDEKATEGFHILSKTPIKITVQNDTNVEIAVKLCKM